MLAKNTQWSWIVLVDKSKTLWAGQRRKLLKAGRILSQLSLSSSPSFLETLQDPPGLFCVDVYSVLTFKPMYSLHLEISKLLKNCFVGFDGYRSLCSREGGSVTVGRTFWSMKVGRLGACNSFRTSIEKDFLLTGLHVCISQVN